MSAREFHFVGAMEGDIPVALCLEYDFATQTETMDELPESCLRMLRCHVEVCREEGLVPWTIGPPPDDAVAEIRAMPGAVEFTVTLEES